MKWPFRKLKPALTLRRPYHRIRCNCCGYYVFTIIERGAMGTDKIRCRSCNGIQLAHHAEARRQ